MRTAETPPTTGGYCSAAVTSSPLAPQVTPVGLVVVVVDEVVVVVVGLIVVVVVVVVGRVVDVVVVVVGPVVDVVVLVGAVVVVDDGVSRAATTLATQSSTSCSSAAVLPVGGRQSLLDLLSSFAMHPFSGAAPPSNLTCTLSTQPSVFGSVGFPGLSAFW